MENNTQSPTITVQDLATIHALLDVACTRGAFKAEEASKVGEVYDKLTVFLQSVIEQARIADEQTNAANQGETK